MSRPYQLTSDPLYYVMGAIFALLTTALPAVFGLSRFLPLGQAIVLTIFIALPLRKGLVRHAALMLGLWLMLQLAAISAVAWLAPNQAERAIAGGFELRTGLLAWLFAGAPLPRGLATQPLTFLVELAGVTLGSLLSGGFVGDWFLVRAVNVAGFTVGSLTPVASSPRELLVAFPLWSLARIAGYAGLILVLAQPLWRNQWSLTRLAARQRRLLIASAGLLALSLLVELLLSAWWQPAAQSLNTIMNLGA